MQEEIGEDGCPIFKASISLDLADQDRTFKWGVVLDGPQGSNFWGIPTEVQDVNSVERYRQFRLNPGAARPRSNATTSLTGAAWEPTNNSPQEAPRPALRFAVWAPNARSVEVVFGRPASGYIADDGTGIDPAQPVVTLSRSA